MSAKRILLAIVLFDFAALNAWVVYELGYVGLFQAALSNLAGIAVMVDLTIALSIILVWMFRDARAKGLSFAPYAVLTLLLGSIGPLVYLLRRPEEEGSQAYVAMPARA